MRRVDRISLPDAIIDTRTVAQKSAAFALLFARVTEAGEPSRHPLIGEVRGEGAGRPRELAEILDVVDLVQLALEPVHEDRQLLAEGRRGRRLTVRAEHRPSSGRGVEDDGLEQFVVNVFDPPVLCEVATPLGAAPAFGCSVVT